MKATQTAQHTATPWKVYPIIAAQEDDSVPVQTYSIGRANLREQWGKDSIAVCVDEQDAAFIVRAVNCHDELLAALKDAVNQLETNRAEYHRAGYTASNERTNMTSAAIHAGRSIIARATNG